MKTQLPADLEQLVHAKVRSGRFPSRPRMRCVHSLLFEARQGLANASRLGVTTLKSINSLV